MEPNNTNQLNNSFEKIPLNIFNSANEASLFVAKEIANLIKERQVNGRKCVLGLATGNTPLLLYKHLVRMHKEEKLSFKNVITFNLDEYYPIAKEAKQSFHSYMYNNLFNHIDIDHKNIHMPSGTVPRDEIKNFCREYEDKIKYAGGIDLQILGIGDNGHIGFNEPGSSFFSITRLIGLDPSTRLNIIHEYDHINEVPRMAITMGVSTIMKARRILLMAWGHKSAIIAKAIEGFLTEQLPASLLQDHSNCTFILDNTAATHLTRIRSPWLIGDIEWDNALIKKAVIELALKLKKPILSLTTNDYKENGLNDLLVEKGDAYNINLQIFYLLRDTITGWPGGKPNVSLQNHPERSIPFPKRCLIFSPHPDDDIISMGGTYQRLQDQGHEVHVAYQTSGNIAVSDEFVNRFLDFVTDFEQTFNIDNEVSASIVNEAKKNTLHKATEEKDSPTIRTVKGLIRRCEAKACSKAIGLQDKQIHFLNLPFYETGKIEKQPISEEDVEITMSLLRNLKPHQIYCAGDFADPHGTHKVCMDIVIESLKRLKEAKDEWLKDCFIWLYKGAWQEWSIHEIEMAIPMSPDQVIKKRHSIYIHQSQKDIIPFQGDDNREFWQRAEERNANTAELYAILGLTRYAAIEAFVRYHI